MTRNTGSGSKEGGGRMGTRSTPGRESVPIVSEPQARADRPSAKRALKAPSVTGNTDAYAEKVKRVELVSDAKQDEKGATSAPVTSATTPHDKHPAGLKQLDGRQDDHEERFKYVDLQLPEDKLPEPFKEGAAVGFTEAVSTLWSSGTSSKHLNIGEDSRRSLVPGIGSQGQVHAKGDTGLFGVILEVWSNHWVLRTSPEDWWVPVLTVVAKRVDKAANHPNLRDYFRHGREGKERITVNVDVFNIHEVNYADLFDKFSAEINNRIKVPGYVSAVTSDFGTSTPAHRIASQITLMKSFQKYFVYEMGLCGCGIKGLEMLGTADDWARLCVKLGELRKLLSPIEDQLKLSSYFDIADEVFANLARSYADGPSMSDWWATVLCDDVGIKYGPSGINNRTVKAYNGWLVQFLTGNRKGSFLACDLAKGKYAEQLSCLSACPLRVVYAYLPGPPAVTCALVGGMLGWHAHHPASGEGNRVVSLQPAHGWCLLMPDSSKI